MAQLTCEFFSEALQMGTSIRVILPQHTQQQVGVVEKPMRETDFPVLYLLHGLSDNHSAWTRYTSIERYADEAGLAVVMPAVGRSFYTNEAHGHRYWDFISDELPTVVRNFFRVSTARADTFVAGLSMGGYGTLKLVGHFPDRYAAAASLSGVVDLAILDVEPDEREVIGRVFGGTLGPDVDVRAGLDGIPADKLPDLHISCGLEDMLIDQNRDFVARLQQRGVNVTARFVPGDHEWSLWDSMIREVIDWLPIQA
ncbi:MAG: alpha/beta hydrolase family protein [Tetrasphaera sp.]